MRFFINTGHKMLFGTKPHQVILLLILAAADVLLFTASIRLDSTAILKSASVAQSDYSISRFLHSTGASLVFCRE